MTWRRPAPNFFPVNERGDLDPAFGRDPRFPEWCLVCGTEHSLHARCPGDLLATGPERQGWKAVVETPGSMEAYGVLVAPASNLWRARIITFPGALWSVPGGNGVLKFVATTPQAAEAQAIRFVERHCAERGYLLRHGLELAPAAAPRPRAIEPAPTAIVTSLAPRWPLVLPVRYELEGIERRPVLAVTRNVSECGVFVQTPTPIDAGKDVLLGIRLPSDRLPVKGQVVWMRLDPQIGRPPGMGIRLVTPPPAYLDYIRSLPPPPAAEGF